MKKIVVLLIIVYLSNFILSNYIVYAEPGGSLVSDNSPITYSQDTYNQLTQQGIVSLDNSEQISASTSAVGTVLRSIGFYVSFTIYCDFIDFV